MRRAYLAVTVAVAACVLFAVFVPFLGVLWPCPSGALCPYIAVHTTGSLTYYFFHFGGVILGDSYRFVIGTGIVF